jgi:large subunit ribosomal protein L25
MSEYKLKSELRGDYRKTTTRQLRRTGKIPAIFYFHQEEPIGLSVDLKELKAGIQAHAHIFELQINTKKQKCILKELQHDPVSDEIIHADFMGITLKEEITVMVPLRLTGSAIGVRELGGILEQHLWELEVKCKATEIPDEITLDISNLNIGDSISAAAIKMENIELLTPLNTSIASVVKATGAKAAEEEVPAEEIEEEEGEEQEEQE